MNKIQGIENLLVFLELMGYPLSEQQVQELILERKIPHSKSFGNRIAFDRSHIQWWVDMQRKNESLF